LDESDCVLAIGFDVVELVRPWEIAAQLVWIAPWENRDPQIPSTLEFVGEMSPVLEALTPDEVTPTSGWGPTRVTAFREKKHATPLPDPQQGRILPQTVLEVLAELAPENHLITTDVGSHKILASLEWPARIPNRFLVSNGLSCMGYGLAAAHASNLILPETQIICLIGDAGLNMSAGGLAPIARSAGRVMVVVFNDGALDLIRSHQIRGGAAPFGTSFHGPDFSKLGEAYGLHTFRANDDAGLREAVRRALKEGKPTLIDVAIDPVGYPTTPGRASITK
jgi:thiamine pyrophosphate-dependent acetolactate synthase large subunit-like protein